MVKNSRSFELTKLRHYLDKPYRAFYEKAKGAPPVLPALRNWRDELLVGAISPGPAEISETVEKTVEQAPAAPRKTPSNRTSAQKAPKAKAKKKEEKKTSSSSAPLVLAPRQSASKPSRKALALGAAVAPIGESCDLRDILASAGEGQGEAFDAMIGILKSHHAEPGPLADAAETLRVLHRSFGDDA